MKLSLRKTYPLLSLALSGALACSSKSSDKDSSTTTTDTFCASLTSSALTLALDEHKIQFFISAQELVRDLIPEPIEVHIDESSFIEGAGVQHVDFHFALEGTPLCQFEARVHSMKEKTYVEGMLPDNLSFGKVPAPLEAKPNDLKRIQSSLKLKASPKDRKDQACLAWDGSTLVPALEVYFKADDLPYYALITEKDVLRAEPRFFDVVNAQSQVYVKQPTNSTTLVIKTIALSGMSDGGSLCSARFQTVVPTTVKKAFSTNSQFFFSPTDQRFKETAIFTNVTTHSNWFLSLGVLSSWPGPKIDLLMDGTNNFLNNSSVYLPQSSGSNPTIKLGAGDGKDLQNLYFDYDVVSHELGHHIVYRTLKTTSGESLVLHEGLADFFVFGDTNDPCLGRLICPSGGKICYSTECLRTGEFPLNFGDSGAPTEAHKLSQVISSMLWDIGNGNSDHKVSGIGVDVLSKEVLTAVDFLPSNAGYAAFINALMKADQTLKNGNCATIEKAAKARGFTSSMASAGVSCSNIQ